MHVHVPARLGTCPLFVHTHGGAPAHACCTHLPHLSHHARHLTELSCVQVDEPALREGLPLKRAQWAPYLRWAVDAFRLATAGAAAETQVVTHLCYSDFADILGAIDALDGALLLPVHVTVLCLNIFSSKPAMTHAVPSAKARLRVVEQRMQQVSAVLCQWHASCCLEWRY